MTKRKKKIHWRGAAAGVAAAVPRERLHPAVVAWAEKSPPQARWSVAFSGGADSLALLLLLWAHWPRRRARLQALHFNHRLRGRESDADETFCRKVCAALRVKFVSGWWTAARKEAGEAVAREARHAFFAKHSRALWLGHQQDDIAESMLMRLARGSGAGGLAAPRPVQRMPRDRVHLRPLLTCKKEKIVQVLRGLKIPWREDTSNAAPNYFRNRLRHEVLTAWIAAAQRDALAGAARARELIDEDDTALETWLAALKPLAKNGVLLMERLAGKPRALLRRALHQWLLAHPKTGVLSRQGFDALLLALERGVRTRHSVGGGFAVIEKGRLTFTLSGNSPRTFQRRAN
jgi:tRNA(Ile)-lysidine synthase